MYPQNELRCLNYGFADYSNEGKTFEFNKED